MALEFTIKDKSGKPITVEGGVTINVDTNLKDEDVNIVLPNTVFE